MPTSSKPALGTEKPVHAAATGATPATAVPSQGTAAQFERFLQLFADTGYHKKAAEGAGLALEAVAARIENDEAFADRYKLARRTRRMLVEDAVLQEALGVEHRDPVNGVVKTVRDKTVLQRLAVKDGVLDPEQKGPTVAIQNNNVPALSAAGDPVVIQREREQLLRYLEERALKRLPKPAEIVDAEVAVADPNGDLL